jgi:peptide/nickel transport system permease protein
MDRRVEKAPKKFHGGSRNDYVSLYILSMLCVPVFFSYKDDIIAVDVPNQLQGPSVEHIFGTDELGRDIFARVLWGGRTTIFVSFCALIVGFTCGAILGTIAAYYNRYADTIIMRIIDVIMAIPSILLMITLATIMNPTTKNLIFVVGFGLIPNLARMNRGQVLQVSENEYIEAVRIQGQAILRLLQATSCECNQPRHHHYYP